MEIGEEQDMLREQLNTSQQSFSEERGKSEKPAKNIQVLQKYLKWSKEARKAADNSNGLHSYSLK